MFGLISLFSSLNLFSLFQFKSEIFILAHFTFIKKLFWNSFCIQLVLRPVVLAHAGFHFSCYHFYFQTVITPLFIYSTFCSSPACPICIPALGPSRYSSWQSFRCASSKLLWMNFSELTSWSIETHLYLSCHYNYVIDLLLDIQKLHE